MNIKLDSHDRQSGTVLGYRVPAEWEEHEATWLAWPHHRGTWSEKRRLERVQEVFIEIMESLLLGEKVHLLVANRVEQDEVLRILKERGAAVRNLIFHLISTSDIWIRDYGPIFLKDKRGRKAWSKWRFNAWGKKYRQNLKDDRVFVKNAPPMKYPCFYTDVVLEGGSIDVNGEGDCLTTEQCLLHSNRNPALTQSDMEEKLKQYLGISRVIWLRNGIRGDDTDGHVDNLARFVAPDTILVCYEGNSRDENYAALRQNWQRLRKHSSLKGGRFELVKLPMPGKVMDGRVRLPASYANFYIANQVVFLPVYDHPNDKKAAAILQECFPSRRIKPVLCRDIVFGLGAIHCLTQQEPL